MFFVVFVTFSKSDESVFLWVLFNCEIGTAFTCTYAVAMLNLVESYRSVCGSLCSTHAVLTLHLAVPGIREQAEEQVDGVQEAAAGAAGSAGRVGSRLAHARDPQVARRPHQPAPGGAGGQEGRRRLPRHAGGAREGNSQCVPLQLRIPFRIPFRIPLGVMPTSVDRIYHNNW